MNITDEQRAVGAENYNTGLSASRRDFLKGTIAAAAVPGVTMGAMYFGYERPSDPLRIGVIGTGDEGQVLIGACNPDYVQVVALADIRDSSIHRAFYGDYKSNGEPVAPRPGILKVYEKAHGWKTREEAEQSDVNIRVYKDYKELLKDDRVEAVIIALPLHLHDEASIAAMQAGKHVLCEKLMAKTVKQCKAMAQAAKETGMILAVGHQRHYSVLYENAKHLIKNHFLGQLHHIRAQWHRGNLPGADSWSPAFPGEIKEWDGLPFPWLKKELNYLKDKRAKETSPKKIAWYDAAIAQWEHYVREKDMNAAKYGYDGFKLSDGTEIPGMRELIQWRLWDHTGAGIMAELGSHQLDAASIFVSALGEEGHHAHPLTVHAVGGRHIFPLDREVGDHVYCMFEFPAPEYDPAIETTAEKNRRIEAARRRFGYYDRLTGVPLNGIPGYEDDKNKRIVVTYSSINGNEFGGYGEVVMGAKRTLVIEREQDVLLFNNNNVGSKVKLEKEDEAAVLDTQASGVAPAAIKAATGGPVSRGYAEEIEHWAYCVRNPSPENTPRCNPTVALGDAVIALTTTLAVKRGQQGKGGYIEFKPEWFDPEAPDTPEDDPKLKLA